MANRTSPTRDMARRVAPVLAVTAVLASTVAASAQDDPLRRDPPREAAPADPDRTGTASPGGSGGSLSEQLSRSGGVIRPPAGVDPGMAKPPPDIGSPMPVIPPPGTPGGNPDIKPK